MTLDIIIQAIVFFGSFGSFAVGGSAIASIILNIIFTNGINEFLDNEFLVCFFGIYGGAILGVCIWIGVILHIMNYLF